MVPVSILAGVLVSVVFAALNALQLGSLQRALDGLAMPETFMTGYQPGYVGQVQSLMTDELYEQYGAAHYLWGVLFPVVFAATLVLLIWRLTARRRIRWLLLPIPVIYLCVDIAENILIETMFAAIPVDPGTVAIASAFTVLKFVLLAACFAVILIALQVRPRST
ncbi:hypothetical protein [Arthrobacter sp. HLT1-21]